MSSETHGPRDSRSEPLPTLVRVEHEVAPITGRRSVELWILAIVLSLPAGLVAWTAVLSARFSDWETFAEVWLFGAFFFWLARNAWRARRRPLDPITGEDRHTEAFESRAMLQALERYDRLLAERQAVAGPEGGGESDPTRRPEEIVDERVDESAAPPYESAARRYEAAARRYEAAVAAWMKERGDPG